MSQFFVKGIPTKRRPRFTRTGGAYTDSKTREEEALIASKYNGEKIEGEVYVRVDIFPKLPKNTPKRVTSLPSIKKPDVDNTLKIVQDALIGIAYDDDKQVTEAYVVKHDQQRIEWEYIIVTVRPRRSTDENN